MKNIPVLAQLALLLIGCCGLIMSCREPEPRLVPISEIEPLMTYQNSSPRFSLKVFMYAPGNFLFQLNNLLPGFSLVGLPEMTSPSGRVLQARLLGDNEVEFNLLLPGEDYRHSGVDLSVHWVLAEKGPEAFLRSEGTILVDIASTADENYFVRQVQYMPSGN